MKKELGDYIADLLGAVNEIEEFVAGMDFQAFFADSASFSNGKRKI